MVDRRVAPLLVALLCITTAWSVLGRPAVFQPAKILFIVEVPASSHINCLYEGMRELLTRNHSVTVLAPPSLRDITKVLPDLEFIALPTPSSQPPPLPQILHQLYTAQQSGPHYNEVVDLPFILAQFLPVLYDNDFTAITDLLTARAFDVAVVDFFAWPAADVIRHRLPARSVPELVWHIPSGLGIFGFQAELALPSGLSSTTELHDRSLFTRLKELHLISGAELDMAQALAVTNAKRTSLGLPLLHNGAEVFNGAMVLVAQSFDFEYARSLPPNVKMIGRMQTPSRPLTDDEDRRLLARLDDLHAQGQSVVYLAFGSLAYLDPEDLQRLVEGVLLVDSVFLVCLLPRHSADAYRQHFEQSLAAPLQQRVLFAAWVHQVSVLQHPATRVFITHGGAQSLVEAFDAGIATLCLPFFGDQPSNCARVRERGAGLSLFRFDFTAQEVAQKIGLLIANPSFGLAARRLDLFRRFTNPAVQFSLAVEEAAYFGASHLIPISESLSLVERYSIDILVGLASLIFSALLLLVALCKWTCTPAKRS